MLLTRFFYILVIEAHDFILSLRMSLFNDIIICVINPLTINLQSFIKGEIQFKSLQLNTLCFLEAQNGKQHYRIDYKLYKRIVSVHNSRKSL